MSELDYEALAAESLEYIMPREKRRPATELERNERVQVATMRFLLEHDLKATPAQLIEFFGFSQARLTKILGELEEKGYVRRERALHDRRRVTVYLTDEGYHCASQTYQTFFSYMTKLLQALGEEDAAHFVRIIGRLSEMGLPPKEF